MTRNVSVADTRSASPRTLPPVAQTLLDRGLDLARERGLGQASLFFAVELTRDESPLLFRATWARLSGTTSPLDLEKVVRALLAAGRR